MIRLTFSDLLWESDGTGWSKMDQMGQGWLGRKKDPDGFGEGPVAFLSEDASRGQRSSGTMGPVSSQ